MNQKPNTSPSNKISVNNMAPQNINVPKDQLKKQIEADQVKDEAKEERSWLSKMVPNGLEKNLPEIEKDGQKIELTQEQKEKLFVAANKFETLMFQLNEDLPNHLQKVLDEYSPRLYKTDGSLVDVPFLMANPHGYEFLLAKVGVRMKSQHQNVFKELEAFTDDGVFNKGILNLQKGFYQGKHALSDFGDTAGEELKDLYGRGKEFLLEGTFMEKINKPNLSTLMSGGALTYVLANGWPEHFGPIGATDTPMGKRYGNGFLGALTLMYAPPRTVKNAVSTIGKAAGEIVTAPAKKFWQGLHAMKGTEDLTLLGKTLVKSELTKQRETLTPEEREAVYVKDVMPVVLQTLQAGTPLHTAIEKIYKNREDPKLTPEEIQLLAKVKAEGGRARVTHAKAKRRGNIEGQYVLEHDNDLRAMMAKAVPDELIKKYSDMATQEAYQKAFSLAMEGRGQVSDLSDVVLADVNMRPTLTTLHQTTQKVLKKLDPSWAAKEYLGSQFLATNGVEFAIQAWLNLCTGLLAYDKGGKLLDWMKDKKKKSKEAKEKQKKDNELMVRVKPMEQQMNKIMKNKTDDSVIEEQGTNLVKYLEKEHTDNDGKVHKVLGTHAAAYIKKKLEDSADFRRRFAEEMTKDDKLPSFVQEDPDHPTNNDAADKLHLSVIQEKFGETLQRVFIGTEADEYNTEQEKDG